VFESRGTLRRVEWVRRWRYDLVWQDGHTGVLSREVDTVAKLRAVVAWARANPRVRRWSIAPVDQLVGGPAHGDVCPSGHALVTYPRPHRVSGWLSCADCPGHRLTVCPVCGVRLLDPLPGPDCGPPPAH
jgi:hypothetical protein